MNKSLLTAINPALTIQKCFFHSANRNFKSFTKWYRSLWAPQRLEPPYCHIIQVGDPVLRQRAEPVPIDFINKEAVNHIIDQMINVLRKYKGVGLAAPQIGVPLRIIVMEFNEDVKKSYSSSVYEARQMSILPLTVFINPEIKITNYNKRSFIESCASVKGYEAVVDRYEEVQLTGVSQEGHEKSLDLKGWNARIAQHEMDHLDGKIYTDVMDRSSFSCTCWQVVNDKEGRIEIPFYK